ncbi:MAG: 5-methyltetrahydropteroyltriglutamate--homocysteine methyltransferase [Chloroflexi bacterium]|jgi:5-methyltetrahydropteroyltriglutamate--homocysteine methyltransferase|nr:MAG: 5-methyltetrahydropteroyltriglutamate--homocysteine methyltransferase [Chloroflexota bacterium]
MKLSTDRILTTHVGSLPRPDDVAKFLLAKENGDPVDQEAFDTLMRQAVSDAVAKQVECGIDVVSDGEMSKIGYSTYVKDRVTGFGGDSPRKPNLDVAPYPEFREMMARLTGVQPFKRPMCVGPIAIKDPEPLRKDIEHHLAALDGSGAAEGFMNAASPGVIASFLHNDYYPTHEAYIQALAEVMKEEYEAIVGAGLVLQIDCPDLAMSRHTGFQDLTDAEFLVQTEMHVEALNYALENVPADAARMHICWGNYEGPHTHDIALEKILSVVLKAKPSAILFEASNPRHAHEWVVWRDAVIPDEKVLVPGVLDSTSNFVEHPELVAQRICSFADIVGRERVIAGTDCGFGTFAGFGKMDGKISYAKLQSMAKGAAIASERLW